MRVNAQVQVRAPIERVWTVVADPERALSFMSGITRWEAASDPSTGLGARYRMLFRIGAAEVGGLIEIVEWEQPHELAWTSVTGLDQRSRWRLRDRPHGRTRVSFRISYGVAGAGVGGWIAERVAAPAVRSNLRRSLQQLKRQVEHEQQRLRAAERRKARVG